MYNKKFGITVNYNTGDTPNEYFDKDGNKIRRTDAVMMILRKENNGVLYSHTNAFL